MLRNLWALIHFVMLSAAGVLLSSCSSSNHEERRWTEDVLLEDGSAVPIERYVAFDATNAMGGGAYNAVETKSTLAFRGSLSSLPAWDSPRIALVLYRSSQTEHWTVVSTSSSCEVWGRNGKPRPPYWQYDLIDGHWKPVPLSEESVGKNTNLFYRYWKGDFPEHVTPQVTKSRQSDPSIADLYRHIAKAPKDFHCMG